MRHHIVDKAARFMRLSGSPAPFAAELEPCVFYRITPKAGPIIGGLLMIATLIVVLAGVIANGDVAWTAGIAGLGIGAMCVWLPRMAGRWPGSDKLTAWEIAFEDKVRSKR